MLSSTTEETMVEGKNQKYNMLSPNVQRLCNENEVSLIFYVF